MSWSANTEPDISSYIVEKYVTANPGWQYLTQTSFNHYEDISESICVPPPGGACQSGHWVRYRVKAVDTQAKVSVPSDSVMQVVNGGNPAKISVQNQEKVPSVYSLTQNYPNPFNPNTTISYSIKDDGIVKLIVYDMLGRKVTELVNEQKQAGTYFVEFNAANLPSGIYFYRLTSGNFSSVKKLILLK